MKKIIIPLLLLLVTSVSLGAVKEPEKLFTAKVDPDGVQRVEIVGGSYYFDPNHIIVKVNVPVELKVRKEGGMTPHNLVMKAPEAGMEFETPLKGEINTVTFTPKKTGLFHFYCSKKLLFLESHRDKGMEGVIEVVE